MIFFLLPILVERALVSLGLSGSRVVRLEKAASAVQSCLQAGMHWRAKRFFGRSDRRGTDPYPALSLDHRGRS